MSRRWVLVLLVGLLVADVVVLLVAFGAYRGTVPRLGATDDVSFTPPSAGATTGEDDSAATAITGPVMVGLNAEGVVLRATRGACEERFDNIAAVAAGPLDGGGFATVELPGLVEVLGIGTPPGKLVVTGLDADCSALAFESTDRGATWQKVAEAGIWSLTPDTTSGDVIGPGGDRTPLGCAPQQVVTGLRATALAGCGSSLFFALQPRGKPTPVAVDGFTTTSVAAAPGEGRFYLFGATEDCGAQVGLLNQATQSVSRLECLGPGRAPLAIAADQDLVLVQVGNDLEVSRDGGKTFERAG